MADVPSPTPALLRVRDLEINIGQPPVKAVRGIEFDLNPGEILGLAGESGSGKSVTAMALARLLPASATPTYKGSVRLKGVEGNLLDLGELALRRVRGSRIAYVFQEPSSSFNPVYTIESHLNEILKLAGKPSRERTGAINQALEEVGIKPDRNNLRSYPSAFSGGMLQRLAIACALVAQPDILVADEPTTALDTSTQKRIVELLMNLNREHGMAILFISHNLGLLKQVAGNLLIMKEGEIVETGKADDVLYHPQQPYTRNLVSCIPKLK
jgi:ABC-type glutathione transport system ATPase component